VAKKDLRLSENEWVILQTVWDLEPCTAPTVQEELLDVKGWAYTTVKTMMDRMVRKGLLKADKIRTLYFYKAAITSAQAKKSEITKTLRLTFDGALAPMMQFLIENEKISDAELDELQRLIRKRKRERKAAKKKR
jgi:BlaI family penicillinase repressor